MAINPYVRLFAVAGMGAMAGGLMMTIIYLNGHSKNHKIDTSYTYLTVPVLAHACLQKNSIESIYCLGVIEGVLASRLEFSRLCLPKEWNAGQATELFVAWAKRHPQAGGMTASDGIVWAHAAAFGCPIRPGEGI